ncbi:hypothetical protein B0H14DRAFT_3497176 [Mycena olivaceomarginata]|nr:hypothetical protein B0H14DRAFT_3497176 [Mycena olivaceomarginata]
MQGVRSRRRQLPDPVIPDAGGSEEICDDPTDDEEPDPQILRLNPITGEEYLTPFFDFDVKHPENDAIFRAVAEQVDRQMKSSLPAGVPENAVWNLRTLIAMAKVSFRGFKKQRRPTVDAEAARRAAVNERTARHFRRRQQNLEHIKSQIQPYTESRGINPAVLEDMLHEQHLSDEASGPEDEEQESFAVWKLRMAAKYGIRDLSPTGLKKLQFVEVLECPWRSEKYSRMLHDMQSMWDDSLTAKQRTNFKFLRVRDTHRVSLRVPTIAPFDFGISFNWLDRYQDDADVGPLLIDWNTHGNPQGFETWDIDWDPKGSEAGNAEGASGRSESSSMVRGGSGE